MRGPRPGVPRQIRRSGKQIERIPQSPTLCSATWTWSVAPSLPPLSLVIHFPLQACLYAPHHHHQQHQQPFTISVCPQWVYLSSQELPVVSSGVSIEGKLPSSQPSSYQRCGINPCDSSPPPLLHFIDSLCFPLASRKPVARSVLPPSYF